MNTDLGLYMSLLLTCVVSKADQNKDVCFLWDFSSYF